jgi:flavin-binding protein dodecin
MRGFHQLSRPELNGHSLGSFELWEVIVSGTVARVSEISARSDTSFEDAVNVGLDRANATLRNVKSAWIKEQSVDVENGVIVGYRVNLLVTFVLE